MRERKRKERAPREPRRRAREPSKRAKATKRTKRTCGQNDKSFLGVRRWGKGREAPGLGRCRVGCEGEKNREEPPVLHGPGSQRPLWFKHHSQPFLLSFSGPDNKGS